MSAEQGGRSIVVNLGRSGYGPEQEIHVLRRFGIPRRPTVCVWSVYEGNDLADIDEYEAQRKRLAECRRTGRGFDSNFSDRCFTANALGFSLRTWIDPLPRRPASQHRGWWRADREERVPIYFVSGDYRRPEITAGPLDRFREDLREALVLCRTRESNSSCCSFHPSCGSIVRFAHLKQGRVRDVAG